MGKAAKRQRKKEHHRARVEEELRQVKAAKRRQLTLLLAGLVLVITALVGLSAFRKRSSSPKATATPTTPAQAAAGCPVTKAPPMTLDASKLYRATMETSKGTLVIDLDAKRSPKTVNSFVSLARCGFYDGLTFHRIVKDFAIQGGDPKGDGTGGPPYKVTEAPPKGVRYTRGVVAMAKGATEQAGTSGSQFFIVPSDSAADRLTPDYALLGKVSSGLDVVDKLEGVALKPAGPDNREGSSPVDPPRITKLTIVEPAGTSPAPTTPTASPAPSPAS